MRNEAVLEQIEVPELIQSVNDGRDPADPFKLPAYLRTLLNLRLADLKAKDAATLLKEGDRAAASAKVRSALEELRSLHQQGYCYCSARDDEDQTPELAKIGKQPRRPPGGAEPQPRLKKESGTFCRNGPQSASHKRFPTPFSIVATFDAAGLTLSVAAMPDYATTLRAVRQPAGGTAQLAGTSTTTTVSVIAAGPLTPGVTYEFWLVGHNSQGDGPESNHVTHAVPVGP